MKELLLLVRNVGLGGMGLFVWDLTEPENKLIKASDCIQFMEGHYYHFSIARYAGSFSHLAFLHDCRKIDFYDAINCPSGEPKFEQLLMDLKATDLKMTTDNLLG